MAHVICYEVFPTDRNIDKMRNLLVGEHGFREKQNSYGTYFYSEVSSCDSWQIKTLLNYHRFKYRCFDSRYERSGNYRKTFFETHKGPYRCAYCGKWVTGKNLEVDHLVPVSKAKTSVGVRAWLHMCGILNVNNPKNLVASCKKCNGKKSDKMGFWVIRGSIGRFKTFWMIRDIVVIFTIALIAYYLFTNYPIIDWTKEVIAKI